MLKHPATQRLHLHSIEEVPSGIDQEIADLFREMRQATGASLSDIASRLGTPPATIIALERGDIGSLPAWPETNRIVISYAEMLSLDPDPVLRRIMLQLPPDHPHRAQAEAAMSNSIQNLQSNINAAISRVPEWHIPTEREALAVKRGPGPKPPAAPRQSSPRPGSPLPQPQPQKAARGPTARADFAPGYGDMRAYPPENPPQQQGKRRRSTGNARKNSLFVGLTQLFLLLILLSSGYAMWLAMNDPQGFEHLKTIVSVGLHMLGQAIVGVFKSLF